MTRSRIVSIRLNDAEYAALRAIGGRRGLGQTVRRWLADSLPSAPARPPATWGESVAQSVAARPAVVWQDGTVGQTWPGGA